MEHAMHAVAYFTHHLLSKLSIIEVMMMYLLLIEQRSSTSWQMCTIIWVSATTNRMTLMHSSMLFLR
jgi:Gpi18-like mannosyltransferase